MRKNEDEKIFILVLLTIFCVPMFAQIIYGLDEPSLLGRWKVTYTEGIFVDQCPIEFNLIEPYYDSNSKSMVYSGINVAPNTPWPNYFGEGQLSYLHFMIGGSTSGNYTLHLFPKTISSEMKVVNFVFKKFKGDEMILSTYSGNGTIWLEKANKTLNTKEAVDLGLSVKWATCNLGAQKPSDSGDYFAWGETKTKSNFSSSNSKWQHESRSSLQSKGVIDSDGNLTAKYDAATVNWGTPWRIPTINEIEELIESCTWTWTAQDGCEGFKITGPNSNFIFLPAAGRIDPYVHYGVELVGEHGEYWSATMNSDGLNMTLVFYSDFSEEEDSWKWHQGYSQGHTIRPVTE